MEATVSKLLWMDCLGWRVGRSEGEGGGIDESRGGRQSVDFLCSVQEYAVVCIQRVLSCFTLLSV